MSYIKELEKQNEELQQKLAISEQLLDTEKNQRFTLYILKGRQNDGKWHTHKFSPCREQLFASILSVSDPLEKYYNISLFAYRYLKIKNIWKYEVVWEVHANNEKDNWIITFISNKYTAYHDKYLNHVDRKNLIGTKLVPYIERYMK